MTVSTGNGESLPTTESVPVDVGPAACDASVVPAAGGGSGTCVIGEDQLAGGSYSASATYPGDADIASSPALATTPFTVNAAPPAPTITGVAFGGTPASPTVTVSGSGFGTQADLGTPTSSYCNSLTGSNYGNNLYLATSPGAIGPWQAGQGPDDCVGLLISSYSNTRITFTFGTGYPIFGPMANGDSFSMTVLGSTFSSTVAFGPATLFTCSVSGFGSATFPVAVSESPTPPATIDAGGTFQEAQTEQATIPASVINHFRGMGATSLTVGSQTATEVGLASVGGAPSGAVSPSSESASATNLPVSDSALVADTPFSYSTAYNPVTWQTGPGTGTVYLTPGAIDAEVTFVISGTPTTESITCAPPSRVAALGSTTVNPPPTAPTFQVPSPTPPLQNQVSAGTDGGWGFTISNTSQSTVDGLTTTVDVADGVGPVTFDLAGMTNSGTYCTNAGPGQLTCSVGDLFAGTSRRIDVLVDTTGVARGTTFTGSATVTSTNASSQSTTLGPIAVSVVSQRDRGGGCPRHLVGQHQAPPLPVQGMADPAIAEAEDQGVQEAERRLPVGRLDHWRSQRKSSTGGRHPQVAGSFGRAGPVSAHREPQV